MTAVALGDAGVPMQLGLPVGPRGPNPMGSQCPGGSAGVMAV